MDPNLPPLQPTSQKQKAMKNKIRASCHLLLVTQMLHLLKRDPKLILICLWEIDVLNWWKGGIIPSPVFYSNVANPPLSWLVWTFLRSIHCNVFHFHFLFYFLLFASLYNSGRNSGVKGSRDGRKLVVLML